MNKEQILSGALDYAKKIYSERQRNTFDGDPSGFTIVYNTRSGKYTNYALHSVQLNSLSKNYIIVATVGSNGSFDTLI